MFDNILNELNTFEDLENIPLPEFSKDEELLKR